MESGPPFKPISPWLISTAQLRFASGQKLENASETLLSTHGFKATDGILRGVVETIIRGPKVRIVVYVRHDRSSRTPIFEGMLYEKNNQTILKGRFRLPYLEVFAGLLCLVGLGVLTHSYLGNILHISPWLNYPVRLAAAVVVPPALFHILLKLGWGLMRWKMEAVAEALKQKGFILRPANQSMK